MFKTPYKYFSVSLAWQGYDRDITLRPQTINKKMYTFMTRSWATKLCTRLKLDVDYLYQILWHHHVAQKYDHTEHTWTLSPWRVQVDAGLVEGLKDSRDFFFSSVHLGHDSTTVQNLWCSAAQFAALKNLKKSQTPCILSCTDYKGKRSIHNVLMYFWGVLSWC